MKKLFLFAFLILFNWNNSYSFSPRVNIKLYNIANEKKENLYFGADDSATVGIDAALGEFELFPAFPPSGLYGVFDIKDSSIKGTLWSLKDFRPVPKDRDTFHIRYRLSVQRGISTDLTIKWSLLAPEIDSAFIRDTYTGDLLAINMKDSNSAYVANEYINDFDIDVYYNKKHVLVENEIYENYSLAFPNPFSESINIENIKPGSEYSIVNSLGNVVCEGNVETNKLSFYTADFSSGMYYFIIKNKNKIDFCKKMIKIK